MFNKSLLVEWSVSQPAFSTVVLQFCFSTNNAYLLSKSSMLVPLFHIPGNTETAFSDESRIISGPESARFWLLLLGLGYVVGFLVTFCGACFTISKLVLSQYESYEAPIFPWEASALFGWHTGKHCWHGGTPFVRWQWNYRGPRSKMLCPRQLTLAVPINREMGCAICGKTYPSQRCGRCKRIRYCSRDHQKLDWQQHNKYAEKQHRNGHSPLLASKHLNFN